MNFVHIFSKKTQRGILISNFSFQIRTSLRLTTLSAKFQLSLLFGLTGDLTDKIDDSVLQLFSWAVVTAGLQMKQVKKKRPICNAFYWIGRILQNKPFSFGLDDK